MDATRERAQMQELAERARRRGIRVLHEPISGEWFATSGSQPQLLYRLTGYTCTCPGFLLRQKCGHLAVLLDELGWAPEFDPDPESPRPALGPGRVYCSLCAGGGAETVVGPTRRQRLICQTCGGGGQFLALPPTSDPSPDQAAEHTRAA